MERVRQALLRGSFEPQAAEWRAFFGPETRDDAIAALNELAERVKAATSEDFTLVPKDEYLALRERVKAAEAQSESRRVRAEHQRDRAEAAERKIEVARIQGLAPDDARKYFAQRDEWCDRAVAAERERDKLTELNSGLTRDFNAMLVACSAAEAQRDELVEALERVTLSTPEDVQLVYDALAKVRGEATCEKCKHPAHEPGACGVNVGTGYLGSVSCRCGVRGEAE